MSPIQRGRPPPDGPLGPLEARCSFSPLVPPFGGCTPKLRRIPRSSAAYCEALNTADRERKPESPATVRRTPGAGDGAMREPADTVLEPPSTPLSVGTTEQHPLVRGGGGLAQGLGLEGGGGGAGGYWSGFSGGNGLHCSQTVGQCILVRENGTVVPLLTASGGGGGGGHRHKVNLAQLRAGLNVRSDMCGQQTDPPKFSIPPNLVLSQI